MRKAAELLNLSPPALSKAVRVLEGEVGFRLIAPSGRGIVITDRGRRLADKAPPLIEELEGLARDEEDSPEESPIRIGSFEVFTTYFLGELISKGFPDRGVASHELIPGQMEAALKIRQVDLGITYIPIPSPDLDHIRVAELEMGIFARADSGFKGLPYEQLPFAVPISPISGSPTKVQGLDGWPDDKLPRFAKYKVTMMETALELCRQGVAVAYLPSFVVRLHNREVLERLRLKRLPHPKALPAQKQAIYLIKRKSDVEGDVFKKVARMLRVITADIQTK